jgi:hypothetical protein
VCRHQPWYADTSHSLWCLQTQTDTWHDQPKSMLICAKSEADVYTCRHRQTQSPQWMARCRDTNTRQPMLSFQHRLEHAELLIRAETCTCIPGSRIVKKHANTCSASWMLRHADSTLSFWC